MDDLNDLTVATSPELSWTTRQAAVEYTQRGCSVVPIPHRSKNPGIKHWQQLRLTLEDLEKRFSVEPQNIGVLMGEPSNWLIDVDLDHPRAVEIAAQYLPPTAAIFGRPGKPRSHWIYRVTSPAATKKFKSRSAGMIIEFRSTGAQTVFPPSVHECGESIAWDVQGAEPAVVDPETLLQAVEQIARIVLEEIGERPAAKAPKQLKLANPVEAGKKRGSLVGSSVAACVAAMLKMTRVDHQDGSGRLFAAACRVVEHNLSEVDGIAAIRDYERQKPFPRNWTDDEILARIHDAETKVVRGVIRISPECCDKVPIVIDTDEHRVVTETVGALVSDPEIYQRGGMLVRVLRDSQPQDEVARCNGSATITALPPACLRERMTKFVKFTRFVQKGDALVEVQAHPPQWTVNAVSARGDWPGIRYLAGLSDVPILRANGTLWQTPGYDEKTGVLFEPTSEFPRIPESIGREEALEALKTLLDVVCDFGFESDDHRAAWLASLLTPLARYAFDGPAPLFLIDANVRGAGKGLLAQTIGQIVLGREMPVSSYAHDSEEMRKKITAIALAGDRLVHLDNLEGPFGNDTLDRALTTTRWKDRVLGKSEQVDLPLLPIWYGTGNNVAVAADTTRRIIHIRLDVLDEHPEERTNFKHSDLIGWLRTRRPQLLTSALTILVGYFNAGRPTHNLTPFGSFEGWSSLVREAVVWVGLSDPCLTRTRLAEASDTTVDALGQLIQAWQQYIGTDEGVVASELISTLYRPDALPADSASISMRAALENFVNCRPGKSPTNRQVGNRIKQFRRRVVGKHYLDVKPGASARNGAVWQLFSTKQGEKA